MTAKRFFYTFVACLGFFLCFVLKAQDRDSLETRIPTAADLCRSLDTLSQKEQKRAVLTQLQYLAGEESVETVSAYLSDPELCDPAVRILNRINSEAANQAMLNALPNADTTCLIALVQGLGQNRYSKALPAISALAGSANPILQKAVLFAMSEIALPDSEKILESAAVKAGYGYDRTNAADAYFNWLENLYNKGEQRLVGKKTGYLVKILKTPQQTPAKCFALRLFSLASEEKAVPEIFKALDDKDERYRGAALLCFENSRSPKITKELLKKVKTAVPEMKVQIIHFLEHTNDSALFSALLELLTAKDESVVEAAIEAAGKSEKTQAVAPIIKAMNQVNTPAVVKTGKAALLSLGSQTVVKTFAEAVPKSVPEVKIALLEILAEKRASPFSAVVFESARNDTGLVRKTAYTALKNVVREADMDTLAACLELLSDTSEINAVQDALYAAIKVDNNLDRQRDRLLGLMDGVERKELFFRPLAFVGAQSMLPAICDSLKSNDPAIRKMAADALINWNGQEVIPLLFAMAKSATPDTTLDEILMSCVNKIKDSDFNNVQKLLLFRKANEFAMKSKQRRVILEYIGETGLYTGLMTVVKYLDDLSQEVRQTALNVALSMVFDRNEYGDKKIKTLLEKAIRAATDPEMKFRQNTLLEFFDSLPDDHGFVSLLNGKDLSGWKGAVENPIARSRMNPSMLAEKQKKANDIMYHEWKIENGSLVYTGLGTHTICSEKLYGDFELYIDWKMTPRSEAGIYLRGSPQVKIQGAASATGETAVGSGGLSNNKQYPNVPLVVADNPLNEWNTFYIRMIGETVTVYLNGQLVTDQVVMENYWDRKQPIFPFGQLELHARGNRVEYRDIYIKEIPRTE
ncbi:MAG: DUF1080 domain-containing protein [Dysgonamonadaceae bacterium]|jgi:HEAT repeat protein|nr:DUF1080 domain-containing protein [Dysgonamonadaceae bacterium]